MISFQLWLAFAAAATVVILIPGPTTLMVTGHAMTSGPRVALASLIGVTLGDVAAMTCSVLGFGAILAASAEAFTLLKWAGALYLIYLGIKLWRAPAKSFEAAAAESTKTGGGRVRNIPRAVMQSFWVTMLNPKGILFFAAFMPQFIDPHRATLPQVLILGGTFDLIAAASLIAYIVMVTRARRVAASARAVKMMNRAGGTMLIGAGLLTATLRHRS